MCAVIQVLVKMMLEGGEFPRRKFTRFTYSASLSRLKRGKGVLLQLFCTFPKEVSVIPRRAWSESLASQGVVSRYGECADSGHDMDSVMWSGDDQVVEDTHVWGRSQMSVNPS